MHEQALGVDCGLHRSTSQHRSPFWRSLRSFPHGPPLAPETIASATIFYGTPSYVPPAYVLGRSLERSRCSFPSTYLLPDLLLHTAIYTAVCKHPQAGPGGGASLGHKVASLAPDTWPNENHAPLSTHAVREGQVRMCGVNKGQQVRMCSVLVQTRSARRTVCGSGVVLVWTRPYSVTNGPRSPEEGQRGSLSSLSASFPSLSTFYICWLADAGGWLLVSALEGMCAVWEKGGVN